MLPEVAIHGPAAASDEKSTAQAPLNLCELLPSIQSLRSYVAKVSLDQRVQEQTESCIVNVHGASEGLWGDACNKRLFTMNDDGTATYEFRAGETLRSVVSDILTECQKKDRYVTINYESIHAASKQILALNSKIGDPDLIEAGTSITIPASLMPGSVRH